MACGCSNNGSFQIANIDQKDKEKLMELENKFNSETGKNLILIAWEKK